jgi:hypothetical protein
VVVLLEKASGQVLNAYHGHAHSSYGLESSFAHTDAHVVSASEDGRPCVYDLVSADLVQRLGGADGGGGSGGSGGSAAALAPTALAGFVTGFQVAGRSGSEREGAVVGVACHPSEARLVTSCLDGTAVFWEGTY